MLLKMNNLDQGGLTVTKHDESRTLFDDMSEKRFPSTKSRVESFLITAEKRDGQLIGMETGFPELDKRMDGLQPGIVLVGGRSHHGKTMSFLNLMSGVLSKNKKAKVLYFTIDDSANKIINRLLSNQSGASINDIAFPKRVAREKPDKYKEFVKKMLDGVALLSENSDRLQLIDAADMVDYSKIVEEITISKSELSEDEELVVFIDNFHKIRNDVFKENEIKQMSNGLKELSVALGIPIIMTVELKKTGLYNRPGIDDISDSKALQYDADVILMIHNEYQATQGKTDAVYITGTPGNEIYNPVIEFHLCKNKQGDSHGFLYYAFFGWKAKIKELDKKSFEGYTMIINGSNGRNK